MNPVVVTVIVTSTEKDNGPPADVSGKTSAGGPCSDARRHPLVTVEANQDLVEAQQTVLLPALADLDPYITSPAEDLREAQARDRARWFGRPPATHHTASSWLLVRTGWLTTNL